MIASGKVSVDEVARLQPHRAGADPHRRARGERRRAGNSPPNSRT